ncbi:MAG: pentapeptide repeat-containing protein [Candidatus Korobacteraceae bacterium]
MEGTRPHGADLTGTTLIATDCNGADLSGAKLSPAGLPDANLMWGNSVDSVDDERSGTMGGFSVVAISP